MSACACHREARLKAREVCSGSCFLTVLTLLVVIYAVYFLESNALLANVYRWKCPQVEWYSSSACARRRANLGTEIVGAKAA